MKHFTPELHARTSSLDDAVADAANAEWGRALARYERRQKRIQPLFTPGLKKLTSELRLHDARLVFLAQAGDRCVVVLQPEQAGHCAVWLEYALVQNPVIQKDALPEKLRTSACCFLYDEVDVTARNEDKVFSQSILFTNGLHVYLRFRDVKVRLANQLVEMQTAASPPVLSQSA
jgi:hypothetical protein